MTCPADRGGVEGGRRRRSVGSRPRVAAIPGVDRRPDIERASRSASARKSAEKGACDEPSACRTGRAVPCAVKPSVPTTATSVGSRAAHPDVGRKRSGATTASTTARTARPGTGASTVVRRADATGQRSAGIPTCVSGASGTAIAWRPKRETGRASTTSATGSRSSPSVVGNGRSGKHGQGRVLTEGS